MYIYVNGFYIYNETAIFFIKVTFLKLSYKIIRIRTGKVYTIDYYILAFY